MFFPPPGVHSRLERRCVRARKVDGGSPTLVNTLLIVDRDKEGGEEQHLKDLSANGGDHAQMPRSRSFTHHLKSFRKFYSQPKN